MYCKKLGRIHHRWELRSIPLDTSLVTSSFLASGIRWMAFKWAAAFPVWIWCLIFPVLKMSAGLLAKTSEYWLTWGKTIPSAHRLGYHPPGSPPPKALILYIPLRRIGGFLTVMERLIISASVSHTLSVQWLQRPYICSMPSSMVRFRRRIGMAYYWLSLNWCSVAAVLYQPVWPGYCM